MKIKDLFESQSQIEITNEIKLRNKIKSGV